MPPDYVDEPEWLAVTGAVVVLSLIVSLALVAAGGWEWFAGFLGNSAASWVQAVGSIVAIWGAFSISNRQQKVQAARDLETTRQQKLQRFETCNAVLNRALALFDSAGQEFAGKGMSTLLRSELTHAEKMLASMPLFEIPDSNLVHRIGLLGQSLSHLGTVLDQLDRDTIAGRESQSHLYIEPAAQWSIECKISRIYCIALIKRCNTKEKSNLPNLKVPKNENIREFIDNEFSEKNVVQRSREDE